MFNQRNRFMPVPLLLVINVIYQSGRCLPYNIHVITGRPGSIPWLWIKRRRTWTLWAAIFFNKLKH